MEKCKLCGENIVEEFGKLAGTIVNVKEGDKNKHIFVCSDCQKIKDWLEQAKK